MLLNKPVHFINALKFQLRLNSNCRKACFHEAGHIVAAQWYNYDVEKSEVDVEGNGKTVIRFHRNSEFASVLNKMDLSQIEQYAKNKNTDFF